MDKKTPKRCFGCLRAWHPFKRRNLLAKRQRVLLARAAEKRTGTRVVGIYVFTYHTGIFSGNYRLGDVGDALKEHMRLDGVLESNQLIFVCHSMGGIVVRKFVVERAAELIGAGKEIDLFLVASPSLGATAPQKKARPGAAEVHLLDRPFERGDPDLIDHRRRDTRRPQRRR